MPPFGHADGRKLARYAKALGHPVRISIARLLAVQEGCYAGNLAARLPVAASTLSQHLKVLCRAGLIKACSEPPRIKYCINRKEWDQALSLFDRLYEGTTVQTRVRTQSRRVLPT